VIETIFYFWKIFVQIILIVVLISSLKSVFFKNQYNLNNLRYNTFAMVISVIQLLISLIYYFTTYEINYNLFKPILKNITPALLIFLGWSIHNNQKKSKKKFLRIIIFYGIGFGLYIIN